VDETDLKTPLRGGAADEEIAWLMVDSVRGKWAGHLVNQAEFHRPERSMSQIGG
jgi:cyclic pyranopterin phosphate synthase